MQGPVKEDLIRISTRSSVKDLYRIMHNIFKILTQGLLGKIGKGSSQDLPIRTSTREDFTRISTRSSRKELCKIMQRPVLCEPDLRRAILCGNLQAECPPQKSAARFARRHGHGHVTRAILRKNSRSLKEKTPPQRQPFCASLRSRNAFGHLRRAVVCVNLQGKCRAPDGAPWWSTGLYTFRKNPSVWTRCLGKYTLT